MRTWSRVHIVVACALTPLALVSSELKFLAAKHVAKVRKRLGIGSRMHHKRWIRMRRIWNRFSPKWKELVEDRAIMQEEEAILQREVEAAHQAVLQGQAATQQRALAKIRARAGAGADF